MNPLSLPRKQYREFVKAQRMIEYVDFHKLPHRDNNGNLYETAPKDFVFYWFNRKTITIPGLCRTDGATCAEDLCPLAWHVHDQICEVPYFDDGTPISNILASWIYRSILIWHGFKVRSRIRFVATFLFGGGKVKKEVGWV